VGELSINGLKSLASPQLAPTLRHAGMVDLLCLLLPPRVAAAGPALCFAAERYEDLMLLAARPIAAGVVALDHTFSRRAPIAIARRNVTPPGVDHPTEQPGDRRPGEQCC